MRSFWWAWIQYDWCLHKKSLGHKHTQRWDHWKVQQEDYHLQAKKRRNQPCWYQSLRLLTSSIVREYVFVVLTVHSFILCYGIPSKLIQLRVKLNSAQPLIFYVPKQSIWIQGALVLQFIFINGTNCLFQAQINYLEIDEVYVWSAHLLIYINWTLVRDGESSLSPKTWVRIWILERPPEWFMSTLSFEKPYSKLD